jgi:DNA-binding beta-propeller fold protein YncE
LPKFLVGTGGSLVYNKTDGKIFCNDFQVISDGTNSVFATLNVGSSPAGIAYDSGTGSIYVTNGNNPGTVTVYSGTPSTANPTSSASSSSTPDVQEFSNAALISVAKATFALSFSPVAMKARNRKALLR